VKVEWGEVAQWSKFWMSSESGLARSICPVIGGVDHRCVWPLDRSKLSIESSEMTYYLQEVNIGGEKFIAYRTDGLLDKDFKTMLQSWIAGYYEKKIEELHQKKVEIP
tara:strand:- start:11379 stop:11702 length:324 start_codon:yes stop_codon:yes gene_type:complete